MILDKTLHRVLLNPKVFQQATPNLLSKTIFENRIQELSLVTYRRRICDM
ncbi:hypothetical protein [Bacillus mycoides]|nr:hypothetical protein [Bacillus mycoides]